MIRPDKNLFISSFVLFEINFFYYITKFDICKALNATHKNFTYPAQGQNAVKIHISYDYPPCVSPNYGIIVHCARHIFPV